MAAVPRFHVATPLAAGTEVELPRAVAHHAAHVLRLRPGDDVILFDGRGGEYAGRLAGRGERVALTTHDPADRESPLAVTLVQCWIATDKLDWVVEKAVELGAARILLAPGRRSVVRIEGERRARRIARLQEIAIAACCQSGRNRVPAVAACDDLQTAFETAAAGALGVVLSPAGERPLSALASTAAAFAVAVGPEGGFEPSELALARRAGYVPARLGPRVLRTETAGLAALAALQATAGDLR